MIYIYDNSLISPLSIFIAKYIFIKHNIECKIINDLNDINSETKNVVLPIGIDSSKDCFDRRVKSALVSNPEIYDILDDKSRCYELVKQMKIPIIPTFSCNSGNQNNLNFFINKFAFNQIFIAKENLNKGSKGIIILDKSNLLSKCANNELTNYIIQPYLEDNFILSFNMVCKNGFIINSILVKQETLFNKNKLLKKNITTKERYIVDKRTKIYQRIQFYCSQIISKTKFNGICEIEFLLNKNDKTVFFLEVNPRISGHVMLLYNNQMHYIENIILSYINIIQDKYKVNNYKYLKSSDDIYLNNSNNINKKKDILTGYNLKIISKMFILLLIVTIPCILIAIFLFKKI